MLILMKLQLRSGFAVRKTLQPPAGHASSASPGVSSGSVGRWSKVRGASGGLCRGGKQ